MWFPTDPEQLSLHQERPLGVAFWLEHWLFLHADDSFGLLKARPLGLRSLGLMLRSIRADQDWALIRALSSEIQQYRRALTLLALEIPNDGLVEGRGAKARTSEGWVRLAWQLEDWDNHVEVIGKLAAKLRAAISADDLALIAFLNRRLASELADHCPDKRTIFTRTRDLASANGVTDIIQQVIEDVTRIARKTYAIAFQFAEVKVPARATAESSRVTLQFRTEEGESPSPHLRTLTGVLISVTAENEMRAREKAIEACRMALTHLRLNFYANTHVIGMGRISVGEESVTFPLRQPFWAGRRPPARDIPRFPSNFTARKYFSDESERSRWLAAREHVSTAIATWPESCHHAASNVWQALESLAGSPRGVYSEFVPAYENIAPTAILRHFRHWLQHYSWKRKELGERTDWFMPPSSKMSDMSWLKRVLMPSSSAYYQNWRAPSPPKVIFGPDGVFEALFHSDARRRRLSWPSRRIDMDLQHLYAVRNHLVHRGERLGSDIWAGYLGALGLEIIFSCAQAKSEAAQLEG